MSKAILEIFCSIITLEVPLESFKWVTYGLTRVGEGGQASPL